MTLTEIFIHSVEACIAGLVLVKLLQVRSLYIRSRPTKLSRAEDMQAEESSRRTREITARKSDKEHLCLKDLPLPEVSFSNNQNPKERNFNNAACSASDIPQMQVVEKCALENYIDDFFSDATLTTKTYTKFKPLGEGLVDKERDNEKLEDEFITIQEENSKIVRQIQLSGNTPKLAS